MMFWFLWDAQNFTHVLNLPSKQANKLKTQSWILSILKKSKHNSSHGSFFRKARGGKKLQKEVVMFYCVRYSMILTAICFGSQPQQVRQTKVIK